MSEAKITNLIKEEKIERGLSLVELEGAKYLVLYMMGGAVSVAITRHIPIEQIKDNQNS